MSVLADVEDFVARHGVGVSSSRTSAGPTPAGYSLTIACSCGVVFERWVLAQDAEEDLLRSGLSAFEN